MSNITGFGFGGMDAALSDDKTEVLIIVRDAPQPMRYKIRSRVDGTLEIINLDDDEYIVEEIESILNDKIWARENREYESYELMGMFEAAQAVVKYIREKFVAKD